MSTWKRPKPDGAALTLCRVIETRHEKYRIKDNNNSRVDYHVPGAYSRTARKLGDPVTRSSFLLNTFVTVTLYDSEDQTILDGCMTLCSDYEKLLSRTLEGSEIYKLNHRRPGERTITVSEKTAQVLSEGLEYCRMSRGAFDITIEPLSSLWDFTGKTPHVPPEEEIEALPKGWG